MNETVRDVYRMMLVIKNTTLIKEVDPKYLFGWEYRIVDSEGRFIGRLQKLNVAEFLNKFYVDK